MMYYHFLKQQKADPCSEMGGFTRLLNTFDGGCDDLCDEMPTFSVRRMVRAAAGRGREAGSLKWGRRGGRGGCSGASVSVSLAALDWLTGD